MDGQGGKVVVNDEAAQPQVQAAVSSLLDSLGLDTAREGLRDTPARVARMYGELLRGMHEDAGRHLEVQFDEQHRELVLFRDIRFYSLCEHHLLPFFGLAHIAYIPDGHITGLSKVLRTMSTLAAQPQVQERLTSQMADLLMERLKPLGAAVVLEARHLCMEMRGVRSPGSVITTSALRGAFEARESTRMEFFTLIRGDKPAL